MTAPVPSYCVVIPTIGRPSLQRCLDALAASIGPAPDQIVVVDDRPSTPLPLPLDPPSTLADRILVVETSGGRGPAAARNVGWRAAEARPWVVFVDDDVEVGPHWFEQLRGDLDVDADVGGVQGVLEVPLPGTGVRRPTDWERNTAALAGARWATADMAYRRDALVDVAGFDERFPRAYREDADLALRVMDIGWRLVRGRRDTRHPVRPTDRWASVRAQAGNADDALMDRLHGRSWHERAGAAQGRRNRHIAITACGALALAAAATGHRKTATAAAAGWLAGTAEFAAARIVPGPAAPAEIGTMLATSALIPPAATAWWLRGLVAHRHVRPWPGRPAAVLFDRDGTLVHDVPYNADPEAVRPMPGAVEALDLVRGAGIRVAVVSNQSGVASGRITERELDLVNERIEKLLGPFDAWAICTHGPDEGCACRKPGPGLVYQAAEQLGVRPRDCVVVGDIGSDIQAARAAGARSVIVPTEYTRAAEVRPAHRAPDILTAVRFILGGAS